MARIRTIKPEFWVDEKIVDLSFAARLLFIGLWNFADDEGRLIYSPKKIKMQIFPADAIEILDLFRELISLQMVEVYSKDNMEVLRIVNFSKHQKVDKRSNSNLPPPIPAESPRIPPNESGSPQLLGENSLGSRKWIKEEDQGSSIKEMDQGNGSRIKERNISHVARKSSRRASLSDEDFVSSLKENPAYQGIDIDRELAKMDAWLQTPKGSRRQKTKGFVVNWLNRTDKPVETSSRSGIDEWLESRKLAREAEDANAN